MDRASQGKECVCIGALNKDYGYHRFSQLSEVFQDSRY
jgi:hypothetical protein